MIIEIAVDVRDLFSVLLQDYLRVFSACFDTLDSILDQSIPFFVMVVIDFSQPWLRRSVVRESIQS